MFISFMMLRSLFDRDHMGTCMPEASIWGRVKYLHTTVSVDVIKFPEKPDSGTQGSLATRCA